jgi:CheY-like chemotaxis protein
MNNFNVLFVDDEENVLKSYIRMFLNEPIKIYLADSGIDALKLFSSKDLDLIITDIKMPDIHGLDLIEEIRKKDPSIPIIVYSAYNKLIDDSVIKNLNIETFYSKPDDYNLLCERIKEKASAHSSLPD